MVTVTVQLCAISRGQFHCLVDFLHIDFGIDHSTVSDGRESVSEHYTRVVHLDNHITMVAYS